MRLLTYLLLTTIFISCSATQEMTTNKYQAPFNGKRFSNYDPDEKRSLWHMLKWRITSKREKWPDWINSEPSLVSEQNTDGLSVTFINHTTFLIQTEGLNILTDPFYSYRASPFTWIGPKRVRDAGVRLEDLPNIDIILLSHNHYEHMDKPALKQLYNRFPNAKIYTGIGNRKDVEETGFKDITEMDWWQTEKLEELDITFVPARHFSARTLWDRNKTLWGGFVLTNNDGKNIYFAGDTAKGSHEQMIADKFDSFELSIIPIGAYEPRWFMKFSHINPEEAVQLHLFLNSELSIGTHFGTIQLTDEAIDAPIKALKESLKKNNLSDKEFIVPEFGKTYKIRD